jgi:hypothetical protein
VPALWVVVLLLVGVAAGQDAAPVPVASSDEASALARETLDRLAALYPPLLPPEVPGFTAVYDARRDGAAAGRLEVAWRREGDGLSVTLTGGLPERVRKALQDGARQGIAAVIAMRFASGDLFAERREGRIVLDATDVVRRNRPGVTCMQLFAEEDLLVLAQRTWTEGGTFEEDRYQSGIAGSRALLASYVDRVRAPDGTESALAYEYGYEERAGHAFPVRFVTEAVSPEARSRIEFTLESVEFRAPGGALEPPVPAIEAGAALARQTCDRLSAHCFSLLAGDAPGFDATFLLPGEGAEARVRAVWDRAGDTMEVEGPGRRGLLLRMALRAAIVPRFDPEGWHAERRDGTVVMESRGAGGERSLLYVPEDLAELRFVTVGTGEAGERRLFEVVDGRAYVATLTVHEAGAIAPSVLTLKYTRRDGCVFLKRVIADDRANGERWEAVLDAVEFRAGPGPRGLAEEIARKADGLQYTLFAAGVKGVDAYYAVRWQQYAAGRIHMLWTLEPPAVTVVHEGNVAMAVADEFGATNEMTFKEWITVCAETWLTDAVLLRVGPRGDYSVRAARTEDGFVLVHEATRPGDDPRVAIVKLAPEGLVRSIEVRFADKRAIVSEYEQQEFEGKWLRKRIRQKLAMADGSLWSRMVSFVYRRVEGVLLPSVIEVRTDPPAQFLGSSDTLLTLEEVEVIR